MKIKLIFGLALSAICILIVVNKIDLNQLVITISRANVFYLAVSILFILTTPIIRSLRWQFLIRCIKAINIFNLLSATSIGVMTDMILPARAGDLVRAAIIGSKEKISKVSSLATIVTERMFDTLTILLVLLLVVIFYKLPGNQKQSLDAIRIAGGTIAIICILIFCLLLILRNKTDIIIRYSNTLLGFLPTRLSAKLVDVIHSFAAGLQSIQLSWHLVPIFLYSIMLWSAFALSNFFVLHSLSFDFHLSTAYYILLFQVLGVALPSSPGFIGVYHASVVAGFAALNMTAEHALSAAILMHAAFFFPFISLGILFMWRENMSFSQIRLKR
jgi:uncharacterized protein (TIRG00374 family)